MWKKPSSLAGLFLRRRGYNSTLDLGIQQIILIFLKVESNPEFRLEVADFVEIPGL